MYRDPPSRLGLVSVVLSTAAEAAAGQRTIGIFVCAKNSTFAGSCNDRQERQDPEKRRVFDVDGVVLPPIPLRVNHPGDRCGDSVFASGLFVETVIRPTICALPILIA